MLGVVTEGLVNKWQRKLEESPFLLALHAGFAAFWAYYATYAFRKPFSAASYATVSFGWTWKADLSAKTVFVIAQVFGYGISKYIGMRFCSELKREQLGRATIGLVLVGWLALLGFALLPLPLKIVAIFLNGIPLGLVWGLIVRQLEGRNLSEILLAVLSCAYILASGQVKAVGKWLMVDKGVPEFWMPFVTGSLFIPVLLLSVWMLSLMRPPRQEEVMARSARRILDLTGRRSFMRRFLPGMILLCFAYLFLTAYREVRDSYQSNLFDEMGIHDSGAFSRTEIQVAIGVMVALALISLVKDNRVALRCVYGLMISGLAILCGSTWLYTHKKLGGEPWMIATGLGVYLAYVPFGSVLFDRTIAATRFQGTAVFAIYVADALGYTGSVGVQLYKEFFAKKQTWIGFFENFSYAMAIGGIPLMVLAMIYFLRLKPRTDPESLAQEDLPLNPGAATEG